MNNLDLFKKYFYQAVDVGLEFKNRENVKTQYSAKELDDFIKLDNNGSDFDDIIIGFENKVLPMSSNFGSTNFMGFPDSGNSPYAIYGSLLEQFLQQNLINSSFCAPVATQIEIEVIQFFRRLLGFEIKDVETISDVGGIITNGGTSSNSIAMLLAREFHRSGTMRNGVNNPQEYKVVIPKGIGHYSIQSSLMWIGCGANVIEVETDGYCYNLDKLQETLINHRGEIMMVVAYAGDSRSMTIERLRDVYSLVKQIDDSIWLHVDACNGFCLAFSEKLGSKLDGINLYDSVTMDPHKMLEIPYTVSALIIKEQENMNLVLTESDLIMKEKLAFGQITPFIGSKAWISLKLWFHIKVLGKEKIGQMMDSRYSLAQYFKTKLEGNNNFVVLNNVDAFSVMFVYKNKNMASLNVINKINKKIYDYILSEGKYYIHSFPVNDMLHRISDSGIVQALRFFSGNSNLTTHQVDDVVNYIQKLGDAIYYEKVV